MRHSTATRTVELNGKPAGDCAEKRDSAADLSAVDRPLGAAVIHAHFRERYRPVFRKGTAIHTADGSLMQMSEACTLADSKLIAQLADAADAPCYRGGGVNRNALPGFFKNWARTAWADLLSELPDEDEADIRTTGPTAGVELRRLVREAMLSSITFGDVIGHIGVSQVERRPLAGWCEKFAKTGPWRDVRGLKCWSKFLELNGGEIVLCIAIRHELFSQVKADRRLQEMGANKFTRRAQRYGVGTTARSDRPHGQSAVVLATEFVADLTASLGDEEPTRATPEG